MYAEVSDSIRQVKNRSRFKNLRIDLKLCWKKNENQNITKKSETRKRENKSLIIFGVEDEMKILVGTL